MGGAMVHSLAFMEENIRLLAAKPAGECVAASDPLAFTRIEQEVGGEWRFKSSEVWPLALW